MKKIFKKIVTIAGSVLMLGATAGMAAAAAYPSPFVEGGAASVAVVYGADAALSDVIAAGAIQSNLATTLAAQTAEGGGISGATTTGGDSVKLERSTDKFNLPDKMNTFYASIDEGELSVVLAEGIYKNDDNEEFEFEQKIELGGLQLQHFLDSDFNDDKPIIGFDLASGDHVMNYTLKFTPDAADAKATGSTTNKFKGTDLTMLGRTYYISSFSTSATGYKLTLLDTANTVTLTEGETSTITAGDEDYDVSIVWMNAYDAILSVNGVETNKLAEGATYKLSEDTYIAMQRNLHSDKTGTIDKARVSIGTGSVVLENGQEVEMNGKAISELTDSVLTSYITNKSETTMSQIVLEWETDDDTWITSGTELVLPGFETIKLSMAGFNTDKAEVTNLETRGDDSIKVSTFATDGAVDFDLMYLDTGLTYYEGIGEKSTHKRVTSDDGVNLCGIGVGNGKTVTLNESENSYFVATWINVDDYESYVFEIASITSNSGKNSTVLKNLATGGSDISFSEVTDNDINGQILYTLIAASDGTKIAKVNISAASSGNVYLDRFVTAEGLQFTIPWTNATATYTNTTEDVVATPALCLDAYTAVTLADPGIFPTDLVVINSTGSNLYNCTKQKYQTIIFKEETKDGAIGSGGRFNATLDVDATNGAEVSKTNQTDYETEDGSKKYVGYVNSDLATKTLFDKPTSGLNDLEITYHGTEAFADVFVSEAGVVIIPGTTTTGTATELGQVTISDSEVASVAGKNLIVIGGSCINSVAAELIGGDYCGEGFTTETGIAAGEALIKSYDRSGKVALLVAGYNAADTTKAVTYLTNKDPDTAIGSALKVTSATEATAITTTA